MLTLLLSHAAWIDGSIGRPDAFGPMRWRRAVPALQSPDSISHSPTSSSIEYFWPAGTFGIGAAISFLQPGTSRVRIAFERVWMSGPASAYVSAVARSALAAVQVGPRSGFWY